MRKSVLTLVLVFLGSGIAFGDEEPEIQIALPDTYLEADEIDVSGDWWGIYPAEDEYTLESTPVIQVPFHYYNDNSETNETGVTIDVPGERKPVFVVRGLRKARAGLLIGKKPPAGVWRFLFPGEKIDVTLKNWTLENQLVLSATGTAELPKGTYYVQFDDYELRLTYGSNARYQTLLSMSGFISDVPPRIVWAGDLDRDGKTDFVINRNENYMRTALALYLSSAANEGEIVGLVAEWNAHSGC